MDERKGIIKAICVSEKKGTAKHCVESARLRVDHGIEGDAHAGNWHRQVSLLALEKIEDFRARGAQVEFGAFGENLVATGFDFRALPVGTRFQVGSARLQMTQIGKECHTHCAIYHAVGDCIMPREGVFAKVIEDGEVKVGDAIVLLPQEETRPWQAAVITLSDKAFRGEREDASGPTVAKRLREEGYEVVEELLLPDEQALLQKELIRLADQRQLDLILTTGGTGFAPRDITPEATLAVADKQAPGIADVIRSESYKITKNAMLSRAVAVIRGKTLIINLPGSPKACTESMDAFLDVIPHGMGLLRDQVSECAR